MGPKAHKFLAGREVARIDGAAASLGLRYSAPLCLEGTTVISSQTAGYALQRTEGEGEGEEERGKEEECLKHCLEGG